MPDTPAFLSERMRSEAEKTVAFFRSLNPQDWQAQVYTEGSCWKVRQVLAHFVASEASFVLLMRNILDGGEGSPEGFDIDAYNEKWVSKLAAVSSDDLIDQFIDRRKEAADLVAQMQPSDTQRQGRHPFLGVADMAEIIKLVYRHNGIHIRDIRRTLGGS